MRNECSVGKGPESSLCPRATGCCEEHDLYFDSLLQSLGWLHLSELTSANNEETCTYLSVAEHSF